MSGARVRVLALVAAYMVSTTILGKVESESNVDSCRWTEYSYWIKSLDFC